MYVTRSPRNPLSSSYDWKHASNLFYDRPYALRTYNKFKIPFYCMLKRKERMSFSMASNIRTAVPLGGIYGNLWMCSDGNINFALEGTLARPLFPGFSFQSLFHKISSSPTVHSTIDFMLMLARRRRHPVSIFHGSC